MQNQLPIHVATYGSGPRVVLVHGGGEWGDPYLDTWHASHALAEDYQLVVPALRGYHLSPPHQDHDFESHIADIAELLAPGAHLIGHSYGGVVALVAAARRPDAVRSLTVVEPPAFSIARGNPDVEAYLAPLEALDAQRDTLTPLKYLIAFFSAVNGKPFTPTSDQLRDYERPEVIQGASTLMGELPPWLVTIPLDDLGAATFPKLVISGGWSPACDTILDMLEARLPAQRVVIPGFGHGVPKAGKPFVEALRTFWRKVDTTSPVR